MHVREPRLQEIGDEMAQNNKIQWVYSSKNNQELEGNPTSDKSRGGF